MNLSIRPIKKEDNQKLAEIIRQVFIEFNAPTKGTVFEDSTTDDLFTLFQEPRSACYVAELEGEVVGCCGIYPTEGLPNNCAELVKFYLANHARGKSIGLRLLQLNEQKAKELGYEKMYLESLPVFSRSIRIYEANNYKQLSEPIGNSGHTGCNVWMLKQF